eukprot:6462435-Pyramimonas_sp.AAC.1
MHITGNLSGNIVSGVDTWPLRSLLGSLGRPLGSPFGKHVGGLWGPLRGLREHLGSALEASWRPLGGHLE